MKHKRKAFVTNPIVGVRSLCDKLDVKPKQRQNLNQEKQGGYSQDDTEEKWLR